MLVVSGSGVLAGGAYANTQTSGVTKVANACGKNGTACTRSQVRRAAAVQQDRLLWSSIRKRNVEFWLRHGS
jgi:hypothetical protein